MNASSTAKIDCDCIFLSNTKFKEGKKRIHNGNSLNCILPLGNCVEITTNGTEYRDCNRIDISCWFHK